MKSKRTKSRSREGPSPPAVAAGAPEQTVITPRTANYTKFQGDGPVHHRPGGSLPQSPLDQNEEMYDDDDDCSYDRGEEVSTTHSPYEDAEVPTVKTEVGEGSEEQAGTVRNCGTPPAVAGAGHKRNRDNDTAGPCLQRKREPNKGDRPESMPKLSAIQLEEALKRARQSIKEHKMEKKKPCIVVESDEDKEPPCGHPAQKKKRKTKQVHG